MANIDETEVTISRSGSRMVDPAERAQFLVIASFLMGTWLALRLLYYFAAHDPLGAFRSISLFAHPVFAPVTAVVLTVMVFSRISKLLNDSRWRLERSHRGKFILFVTFVFFSAAMA